MPSIISTAAFALLALSAAVSAVPHAACTDGRPSLSGTNDGQDLAFSVFKDTAVNVNAPGGNGQGLAGAFDGTKVSFAKFPKWKRSSVTCGDCATTSATRYTGNPKSIVDKCLTLSANTLTVQTCNSAGTETLDFKA
uniref:Uncharacterized protein n=1 Tax=Moniliophthora roreri TaxID=221103 RepID=A0A0W0F685_MONRR